MARDRFHAHDVLEVKARVGEAVKRARESSLPTLIEIQTYRYRGHSMSDPGKYRSAEEIEARKKDDCVLRAEAALRAQGRDDAYFAALEAEIEAIVEDAVRFADESAEPGEELIEAYTYA
jgi:pyruvate dehydrogenase E1 component alpha subunit